MTILIIGQLLAHLEPTHVQYSALSSPGPGVRLDEWKERQMEFVPN